jgi:hypothetical protein
MAVDPLMSMEKVDPLLVA